MTAITLAFPHDDLQADFRKEGFSVSLDGVEGDLVVRAREVHRSRINGASYGSAEIAGTGAADLHFLSNLFVLVEDGCAVVDCEGEVHVFQPGQSFVAPQGALCRWTQEGIVRIAFSSCEDAQQSGGKLVPIVPQAARKLSAPYPEDLLISESPRQSGRVFFADSTGRWQVGVWSTTHFKRKVIPFPKDEYMYLHAGEVSFEEADGATTEVAAGRSFLLPLGAVCSWDNEAFLDKTYCAVLNK